MTETPQQFPERLTRAEIESRQTERLHTLLDAVIPANPFWTQKYRAAGVDPATVRTLSDLQSLPFAEKSELVASHATHPPYGSNLTFDLTAYSRMHQTSGTTDRPLRWLDTPQSWDWFAECWAQIYRMVGLQPDDRMAFPFSFGPFIGFWAAFEGASRLGNLCLAGGGMSSTARLTMIVENQATVVCCTPTYALRLAEVAAQQNIDLAGGSVRALIVAGEPGGSIPATRSRIEEQWGARVFDHWGMTDIGSLGIESEARPGGLYLLESECIAEIIDPATGQPVEPGTEGELVLTNLGRLGSPLIRYRTGDRVRAATSAAPDGYELLFLKGGILGRADDMVIIRGNNVFPSTLEAILRRHDGIAEYRIVVQTRRAMEHLRIELEPTPACDSTAELEKLVTTVGNEIKDRLNFQAEINTVPLDSLPRFELKGKRFIREE